MQGRIAAVYLPPQVKGSDGALLDSIYDYIGTAASPDIAENSSAE
jgi:hypothetical protein